LGERGYLILKLLLVQIYFWGLGNQ
jgi:hypothetical protein